MPRRAPIDPQGIYHIGSRGTYGRPLFKTVGHHEMFLWMYARVTTKYGITTYAWALVKNHHHFVVELTDGGLSEAMRELHGGYSRWIHQCYGQTGKGHFFRHGFFARRLEDERDVLSTCCYVDLNLCSHRATPTPRKTDWSGLSATLGRAHPRSFHRPERLLGLLSPVPATARSAYRELVRSEHAHRRLAPTPNDGATPRG
ncbi:MAG TPA: transposase [Gaiellaceae bacterium]|nr:transposase [Gaiellaceae bacterium]